MLRYVDAASRVRDTLSSQTLISPLNSSVIPLHHQLEVESGEKYTVLIPAQPKKIEKNPPLIAWFMEAFISASCRQMIPFSSITRSPARDGYWLWPVGGRGAERAAQSESARAVEAVYRKSIFYIKFFYFVQMIFRYRQNLPWVGRVIDVFPTVALEQQNLKLTKVDITNYTVHMNEKKLNSAAIRRRLEQMGFSQADVAAKLGVTRETVSQWLKNNKTPRPRHLLELAEVLELSYDEIVMRYEAAEPQVAYRSHKNITVSTEMKGKAADMGTMLRNIIPYLSPESFFKPAVLENPRLDSDYIQNIIGYMRQKMNITDERVEFEKILQEFSDKKVVLIPVLWGRQGNNALHIKLPKENVHFVYLNLDALISDFKFWLLHELSHIITPELNESEADDFADRFAGAFLFPEEHAQKYYHSWEDIHNEAILIEKIKELASTLLISPLTIYNELNKYAEKHGLRKYSFNIHPAVTNFNKTIHSVSEVLFEEDNPTSELYIEKSSRAFRTQFFDALGSYLREKEKGPGMIQRIMDIPLLDAKGVYKVLVSQ